MIDVLSEIDLFDGVDPDLVNGFLAKGQEMRLEVGDKLFKEGVRLGHFSIILEGAVEWSRRVNGVDIVVGRREAPTYAGAGNALTGDPPVATGVVIEPMRLLRWSAEDFREFIQQAPSAMETTVRLIGPVAQMAESTVRQQEKLAALGTLSAGLAHEMNNPAAAARRTASELGEALDTLLKTVHHFVSSGVEREDAAVLVELQIQAMKQAKAGVEEEAIAAADREDALAAKIDEMGYEGWRLAEPLARARLDNEWLERLAAHSGTATGSALEWVAASLTAHTLVEELHESTERISHLVGAVKDYTYMDRMQIEDLDIHDGIDNTLTILGYRLKHGQIKVVRNYDRSLPRITARGSELNQVWTNLLVNALDALDGEGTITITTRASGARRRGRDRGRRPGHPGRDPEHDLRAVLHHQAGGQGHRAGSRHLPPDRCRPPGQHLGQVAARRDEIHGDAAHRRVGKRSILPLLAVMAAGLAYYGARGSLANFVLSWEAAFDANRGAVSLVATASFLSIGIAQVVGGRLLERVAAWKVLAAGLALGVVGYGLGRGRAVPADRDPRRRRDRRLRRRPGGQLDAVGARRAAVPRPARRAVRARRRRHLGRLDRDAAVSRAALDISLEAALVFLAVRGRASRWSVCSRSCASTRARDAGQPRPRSAGDPGRATSGCSRSRSSSAASPRPASPTRTSSRTCRAATSAAARRRRWRPASRCSTWSARSGRACSPTASTRGCCWR